eukprot:Nk52_evm3s263 gene=Nk52_evmTU3s263
MNYPKNYRPAFSSLRQLLVLVICLITLANAKVIDSGSDYANMNKKATYRVGLVRYDPLFLEDLPWNQYVPRPKAVEIMKANLANIEKLVHQAAKKGAQLVATPEDSFTPANLNNQSLAFSWTETFEPVGSKVNPCREYSKNDEQHFVAHTLSCMARKNGVVLSANVEDRQPCTEDQWQTLPQCTDEGGYVIYNTQIIYDSDGSFITKYWKAHPFEHEKQFIRGDGEAVTFKKWGVEFGLIICFDINFDTPSKHFGKDVQVLQIEHYQNFFPVENAAMTSQGYSLYWNKTLLTSDTAALYYQGSGIYNKGEPLAYSSSFISENGVLVYDVPKVSQPMIEASLTKAIGYEGFQTAESKTNALDGMVVKSFKIAPGQKRTVYSKMDNVKCQLSFETAEGDSEEINYALIAGNGTVASLQDSEYCSFIRCPSVPDCVQWILDEKSGAKWQNTTTIHFEAFRLDLSSTSNSSEFISFTHQTLSDMKLLPKKYFFANATSIISSDEFRADKPLLQASSIMNVPKADNGF